METLDLAAFDGDRLQGAGGLTAVCVHATWCGFCRRFLPLFDAAAATSGLRFALADLSSEDDPRWETFKVNVVPTVLLFDNGALVWRKDSRLGVGLFQADIDALLKAAGERSAPH